MNFVIIGGGKLGYNLTRTLMEQDHDVCLVEISQADCYRIANELDISVICGDGTRVEIMRQAVGERCDCLIAVTSRDEDNLIACELAKRVFQVPKAVARANNPKNMEIMKQLGADITVCPTRIIAGLIEHEIDGAAVRFIMNVNQGDAVISEYTLPRGWSRSGTALKDLDLPQDCVIVYRMRGEDMAIPRGNTVLKEGDELVALTVGNSAKQLRRIFEL